MSEDYHALTQKVERLRDILASKATGGDASEETYRALRAELRAHADIGPLLPDWLKRVRTLDDWWGYIKPLYGTYAERRNFLSKQFDPALSYLEEMDPGLPPPQEPVTLRQTLRQATQQENAQAFQPIFDAFYQGSAAEGLRRARNPASKLAPPTGRARVFVVHGHDHGPRDSVARLLERLDLDAVILEEQPNKGRTIIEKFVDYSDVEYAVVVMTPDDMGGTKNGGRANQRARQNVILELGFFIGKLGRDHVAAVVVEPVETPSDVEGVLYIKYDAIGGWKGQLAREIKAAGLPVDLNRLG